MAFVWDENVAPGQDILASNVNEVQDNIDTIYATLGLTRPGCGSGAGWTEFPVVALTATIPAQPQQLRDAIDYAHENPCPAYNNVYQDGVDSTEDTGYNDGYLAGADTTDKPGYYGNHNPGHYNDEHDTYNDGDLVGYDSTYNPGYKSGEEVTYNDGYLLGVDAEYYPGTLIGYYSPD